MFGFFQVKKKNIRKIYVRCREFSLAEAVTAKQLNWLDPAY